MDKLDQIFIRACKSEDPNKRLESVFRRFFLTWGVSDKVRAAHVLARICDDHSLFGISGFLQKQAGMHRRHPSGSLDDCSYAALVSIIRHTEVAKFHGLTSPLRFRLTRKREQAPHE